jgi:thioesterase domain-containing protein
MDRSYSWDLRIGGAAALFEIAKLASFMGHEQPVYCFQPRGLDGTREPQRSVDAMVAAYVHDMRLIQPEGPYIWAVNASGETSLLQWLTT